MSASTPSFSPRIRSKAQWHRLKKTLKPEHFDAMSSGVEFEKLPERVEAPEDSDDERPGTRPPAADNPSGRFRQPAHKPHGKH